ncbi:MAG: hydrogenase 4 subunit F [Alistipes sp.]|nr:hydrogenase 4 subunit F [Alistipes sp.]MBQ5623671.1 hydrogenase 4 subunit F [Alistipes sp.]MBQ5785982.1 hydrogenase 4 subunit F [Alistipes sp.]
MIYIFFVIWILLAVATFFARSRKIVHSLYLVYLLSHAIFGANLLFGGAYLSTSGEFFTFDQVGSLFYVLLFVVSCYVFVHSEEYLKDDTIVNYRNYFALLMLLTAAITGVYFANNIAVTWILLETTTLCAAGIIYHRHSKATLEATWKYLFVCSTGIAIAYLGILLLCATASNNSLSYADLQHLIINGNPLYLKAAFLLILTGYSCKMEIFPLYTIGVDANFAAPAPASAMISTGLVNAGFLAIFRIYRLFSTTDVFPWVKNVMLIIGLLSLVVGALFLRRTNNYKRFLSYSTVENMGIVAIGLGIGGLGVWAALFHVVCHTFIKSSLFLQIAIVRQIYNGYRINRIGDYININKVGAIGLLLGMIAVLAFPPSPLFISELMIMMEALTLKGWWVVAIMVLLICIVIFTICYRMIKLCYQSNQDELHLSNINRRLSYSALSLLILALIIGFWQPAILRDIIDKIAMF